MKSILSDLRELIFYSSIFLLWGCCPHCLESAFLILSDKMPLTVEDTPQLPLIPCIFCNFCKIPSESALAPSFPTLHRGSTVTVLSSPGIPRLGLSFLASCTLAWGSFISATHPCSHSLFLPLSRMPVLRLTLLFLDILLHMSIVRASCSSQGHLCWEILLGLAIFPNPYELRLPYPVASWKAHLKHASCCQRVPSSIMVSTVWGNGPSNLFSGHSKNYHRLALPGIHSRHTHTQ